MDTFLDVNNMLAGVRGSWFEDDLEQWRRQDFITVGDGFVNNKKERAKKNDGTDYRVLCRFFPCILRQHAQSSLPDRL